MRCVSNICQFPAQLAVLFAGDIAGAGRARSARYARLQCRRFKIVCASHRGQFWKNKKMQLDRTAIPVDRVAQVLTAQRPILLSLRNSVSLAHNSSHTHSSISLTGSSPAAGLAAGTPRSGSGDSPVQGGRGSRSSSTTSGSSSPHRSWGWRGELRSSEGRAAVVGGDAAAERVLAAAQPTPTVFVLQEESSADCWERGDGPGRRRGAEGGRAVGCGRRRRPGRSADLPASTTWCMAARRTCSATCCSATATPWRWSSPPTPPARHVLLHRLLVASRRRSGLLHRPLVV
jgi:hypothetical protein